MPGKPHKSCLIPHEDEILALRHKRPPMPYEQIAGLLRKKYGLIIQYPAIFKFIKVRARGRKLYGYKRNGRKKITNRANPDTVLAGAGPRLPTRAKFQFTPSERYNLRRLPPEEAAAIRKKLEEEGH